jgi:hypothetical protein
MAEYLLISETSAVTMTIAGVIKEVVTVVVRFLDSSLSVVLGLLATATLTFESTVDIAFSAQVFYICAV